MIGHVFEFHEKFDLPLGNDDQLSHDPAAQEFRIKFLQEELDELKKALAEENRVEAFDALLDLAYVVYGTALFLGVSPAQWRAGFRAVHRANMAKIRVASADESKRGSAFDVGKPNGWVGPEGLLEEILSWPA